MAYRLISGVTAKISEPDREATTAETVLWRLPYPPTVNHYWRTVWKPGWPRPRILISKAGRTYRADVQSKLSAQFGAVPYCPGPLKVEIRVQFPDRRKRDLDNLLKGLLDALQQAAVYADDSQIRDLRIYDAGEIVSGGAVDVTITPLNQ